MGRLRQGLFVGAVALVLGAAVGGALAAVVLPVPPPPSLAEGDELETMTPASLDFDDPQEVRVTVILAAASAVRTARAGTLTALACTPGGQLASGTSPAAVDGAPVVALATRVPLWRDIAVGDEGDDVSALETELSRLGGPETADGYWSWSDALALDALLAPIGVATDDDGTLHLASISWIPAPTVTIADCPGPLGSTVASGASVADLAAQPAGGRVSTPPGAVPGDRVLSLSSGAAAIAADGSVADLGLLAASDELAGADPTQEPRTFTATAVLAEPVHVSVLAPSALVGVTGERACVVEGGHPVGVTIVASQLGRTLVAPDRPLGAVALHPDPSTRCP